MKKRIISLALCFLLVFSHVLPVAAVDSSEPACSGSCEDTTSAATHTADCAVYAYYESMSAKGAQHMYENWDAISESDRANLLIWLDAHNPDMAAELRALLTPAAEESTPTETTVPAEPQPAVEEKTLESGEFSVTGKDIPEGAELIIGEFPMPYSADTPAVSMYNIKVYDGDEVWQPANGETVEVSIPVSDPDAETMDVAHFMEDPDKIRYALNNGLATVVDVSDNEDLQMMFEASILGYQEAMNTTEICVAIEVFFDMPVTDGKVTVDANGFSIFVKGEGSTEENPIYKEVNYTDYEVVDDLNEVIYVRPGEWITFETSAWTLGEGFKVDPDNQGITSETTNINYIFFGNYVYFQVLESAQPGDTFEVVYDRAVLWDLSITFKVVEYFSLANVYIGVLPSDYSGYPAEPAVSTDINFHYYDENNTLGNAGSEAIYTTAYTDIVDEEKLSASSLYQVNADKTAYGVADNTGVGTQAVLKNFDAIAEDILDEYCASHSLDKENYKLVVYVVKYEAVGANIGWHINCKVELVDNYILSYNYNPPSGFSAFDVQDIVKPGDRSISTEGSTDGTVTTTVDSNVDTDTDNNTYKQMTLVRKDGNETYTATFVGWNTNPNANPSDTNKTTGNGWYFAGNSIKLTGNTTLYAIWSIDGKTYNAADVTFRKLLVDDSGALISDDDTAFTFTASDLFKGLTYQKYTADGAPTGDVVTFAEGTMNFELSNGESIIISSVPNSDTQYSIQEIQIPVGYEAKDDATHVFTINNSTNASGKLSYDFYNVLKKYSVTYLDGVDGEEIAVPAAQEKIYGTDLVLSNAVPERDGYDFTGWLGSDGNPYKPSGTYTENAALTLTAQWELKTYTVTYDTNGGTGAFAVQTKVYGETLKLHSEMPAKEGYRFNGWLGSDGNTYEAGASYTLNAALTLTAQWKAIVADLKIKTVLNASEPYADQNFVFIVTGDPDDKNIDPITIEVALDGNNEVVIGNMPAGTYTVTEKSGWTWRYNGIQSAKAIVDSDGAAVTFTFGEPGNKLWLSGYHYGKK